MRCPRCNEAELSPQVYRSIPVERCPECRGFQLGLRDLRRIAEAMAQDLVGVIDLDAELPALPDPEGKLVCFCGRIMETFPYLGLPRVQLDRCENCMLVWLDPEELPAVAQVCAQSEGRIRALYETARRDRQTYIDDPIAVMREAEDGTRGFLGGGRDPLMFLELIFNSD